MGEPRGRDGGRELKPLVNRANEGLEAVRAMARERLGPVLGTLGLDEKMEAIEFSDALAHLFWRGDIRRESIPERIIKTLLCEGNFSECDRLLKAIQLDKLAPELWTAFLIITAAAKIVRFLAWFSNAQSLF